jgi:thiamine biosynthesis protein ThiI
MTRVVALLSGGIDSAAAISLALEQGLEIVAVHYSTRPFADERAEQKTIELVELLKKRFEKEVKLVVIPFGPVLKEIAQKCERKLNCVLCRRMMLRIGERLAKEEKAQALLSGESLGQVASQTLSNLNAEAGCNSLPVIRPLLGMDKLEIEKIAKRFDTFGISTMPSACCSIPEKPATAAKRPAIEEEEKKLPVKQLVKEAFEEREERADNGDK